MKRWRSIALGISLCLLLGSSFACASDTVSVSVNALDDALPDGTFTARINISNVTNLAAYDFEVSFDPAILEWEGVIYGRINETNIPITIGIPSSGRVKIVGNVSGTTGVTGSGYLAELSFKASAEGQSAINLENGTLSDNGGAGITATWTGATVRVDPLIVDFTASPLRGIKNSTIYTSTVSFTPEIIGGRSPFTYIWSFGDDVTETSVMTPTHTYTPPGTRTGLRYTIALTVTDSVGELGTKTKGNYITIYQMGDINEDLTVNALDITKIERIVAGIDPQTLTSDKNEDGVVNALDITKTELNVAAAHD